MVEKGCGSCGSPEQRFPFEGKVEYDPELDLAGNPEYEPEGPHVVAIFICPDKGLPMESQPSVRAVAGKGLEGDRYFLGTGAYSKSKPPKIRDVSIISFEAIGEANAQGATEFTPAETRRNIVVSGMKNLNHLVGQTIQLGDVSIQVSELCTPCFRPSKLSGKPHFETVFEDRGGIRGKILTDGEISVGSRLEVILESPVVSNSGQ